MELTLGSVSFGLSMASFTNNAMADPRVGAGAGGGAWSKFFHFHAVFGQKICHITGWRTPYGKSWIRHCNETFSYQFLMNRRVLSLFSVRLAGLVTESSALVTRILTAGRTSDSPAPTPNVTP